jgi:hypothetical protein
MLCSHRRQLAYWCHVDESRASAAAAREFIPVRACLGLVRACMLQFLDLVICLFDSTCELHWFVLLSMLS